MRVLSCNITLSEEKYAFSFVIVPYTTNICAPSMYTFSGPFYGPKVRQMEVVGVGGGRLGRREGRVRGAWVVALVEERVRGA